MTIRRMTFVGTLALSVGALSLTGCSATFSPEGLAGSSVSSNELAQSASEALESSLGYAPDINCGDNEVPLTEGDETLSCSLKDPQTGYTVGVNITVHQDPLTKKWNVSAHLDSNPTVTK